MLHSCYKTKMKKFSLVITTLALFAFSVYLAFLQGSLPMADQKNYLQNVLAPASSDTVVYTGIKAGVANIFSVVMNGLMGITGGSVLWSIVLMALLVELLLLYPSVRLQLKQKKIHIFHKKVVDRFNRGELSMSETKDELYKIYDVNEQIHGRGALLVIIQIALFFFTFWGMNLMVNAPQLLWGSWNALNVSLLSKTGNFLIPLLASLLYFLHVMVKVYFKENEDYISSIQTIFAVLFGALGATAVYFFAGIFPLALVVYFVTLIAFATIRYGVVEKHVRQWGALAQKELIQMLREAKIHESRFEYFSRKWNHLPVVRYINFNLLEEALSMSLGLLLALSFFGAFQKNENITTHAQLSQVVEVMPLSNSQAVLP